MILINGNLTNSLSVYDRATQFGDGCFTTALIKKGNIQLLSYHLDRLKNDCKRLFINNISWSSLISEVKLIAAKNPNSILKVIISRGNSLRGYNTYHCKEATRIIMTSKLSSSNINKYKILKNNGVKLAISPIKLSKNQYLAGIKHLNRLEQVLISIYLNQTDADEVIVLDADNFVIECSSSNLFWSKCNKIYTPKLNTSGINGVMKTFLIKQLSLLGINCYEVKIKLTELIKADELIICNSLIPILPVRKLDNITWNKRKLFDLLNNNLDEY